MVRITEFLETNLTNIIKAFVDYPKEISINVVPSTKTITCNISANRSDYGKIIGKCGKTVGSLNIIMSAIKNTAYNSDLRSVKVELLDGDTPSYSYKRY